MPDTLVAVRRTFLGLMLIPFIFGCSSVELENVESYQEEALNSETQKQSATTTTTATATTTTSATTTTTTSATTTTPRLASDSGYRAASQPSLNPELCKLADRRGLTRYVYEEPIIEGIDYTHRQLNREQNIAYVNPMFSTGFPMVPDMNPSIGTLEVAFLAIDFPDSPGSDAQLDLVRKVADEVANYFHTASDGRLHLNFRFGDRVFRVSKDSDTFGLQGSGGLGRDLTVEVVKAADPHIDFTGVHNLYMLIPENNTQIANDWHYPPHPGNTGSGIPNGSEGDRADVYSVMTNEGPIRAWEGNGYFFYRPDIVKNGGVAMFYVHETLHDLGISDLYRYGYQSSEEIFATGPASLPMSDWSIMSNQNGVAREVIAWHRWLLGWLADEQIYCRPSNSLEEVDVSLSPLTGTKGGYKAAMIPVSDTKVIIIESRRAEGYSSSVGDLAIAIDVDGVRNRGFMRDLGTSGLIAYVYDTSAIDGTGQSWLQIPQGRPSTWGMATCPITNCLAPEQRATARENPWLKWDPDNPENILIEANLDPLIRLGDRVTVEGVTIELIESGQFDRVRISTN